MCKQARAGRCKAAAHLCEVSSAHRHLMSQKTTERAGYNSTPSQSSTRNRTPIPRHTIINARNSRPSQAWRRDSSIATPFSTFARLKALNVSWELVAPWPRKPKLTAIINTPLMISIAAITRGFVAEADVSFIGLLCSAGNICKVYQFTRELRKTVQAARSPPHQRTYLLRRH